MKNILKLTKNDWKGYWKVSKAGIIVSFILGLISIGIIWIQDKIEEKEEEDPE